MRVLMINKFLYPNGGSETYIFKLGEYLKSQGHEVQYFGMEHEGRCVGNNVNAYTTDMNFHGGSKLSKLTYPFKTIYSSEARKKIRLVLDDFKPDVCHLNNFNYQLTPSIILEIVKWRKQTGNKCKIIYTAHDYQLVCPNHMLRNPNTHTNCTKCINGHFVNCVKNKCIHNSFAKSVIGALEGYVWKKTGVYKNIDHIICISNFMKSVIDKNKMLSDRTDVLHNFVDKIEFEDVLTSKKEYVLYFGRYSEEKGIATLLNVCRRLPNIPFIFAGNGPMENEINSISNIKNLGFKNGQDLMKLIREARFSVCTSEWFEPFGLSIAESILLKTPVLGSNIGGIPEVIDDGVTGELFGAGNKNELKSKIEKLWLDKEKIQKLTDNCGNVKFNSISEYCHRLMNYYCSN